jgi:hypothetical protein
VHKPDSLPSSFLGRSQKSLYTLTNDDIEVAKQIMPEKPRFSILRIISKPAFATVGGPGSGRSG